MGPERGGRTSSRTIPRPVPTSPRFAAAASFAAASPWIISRVLMMSNGNVAVSAMQAEAAESTYVVPKLRPLLSGPPPMLARQAAGAVPWSPGGHVGHQSALSRHIKRRVAVLGVLSSGAGDCMQFVFRL